MDVKAFVRAQMVHRTEDVTVKALAPWNDGVAPTITVRGLDGPELARVREAVDRHRDVGRLLEAAVGGSDKEKIAAMRDMAGVGDSLPDDYTKRIEMLTIAAVSPALDRQACVKLATVFPIEFYHLTNKITELTGMGHTVPGKPQPSTGMAEFAQP